MCSMDEGAEFFTETVKVARKQYECPECLLPIRVGTKHVRVFMVQDGTPYVDRVHRECAKLAREAAEVVCGGGDWTIGELGEHLEMIEGADPDRYRYEYGIDPADPRVKAVLLAWEAIEQKYSGVEYETGGEG